MIWLVNGWDCVSTVWRVVFRFKRKFLAEFELNEVIDVLSRLKALLLYVTHKWLRYVDLSASHDSNKSRLPTHLAWEVIQQAYTVENEKAETRDTEGEVQMRLLSLLQGKPLQVLVQTVGLSLQGDPPFISEQVQGMWECFQDEPIEVVQEVAQDFLKLLTSQQVRDLVAWLSSASFQEVQATLIKRSRRIAKRKACIAGAVGYIRSAVALAGDEISGLPGQEPVPDLMASLVWFFGEMQLYDRQRGRVHLEEVWKKRLAYGFVTAAQYQAERAARGIDLHEEDWLCLDEHLSRLSSKLKS